MCKLHVNVYIIKATYTYVCIAGNSVMSKVSCHYLIFNYYERILQEDSIYYDK